MKKGRPMTTQPPYLPKKHTVLLPAEETKQGVDHDHILQDDGNFETILSKSSTPQAKILLGIGHMNTTWAFNVSDGKFMAVHLFVSIVRTNATHSAQSQASADIEV